MGDGWWVGSVVILFPYRSPSPRPHPDPTQHPETDPKQTRHGAKRSQTDPKRTETEPKWTEIRPSGVGRPGGFVGMAGVGVVREKEITMVVVVVHCPLLF